MSDQTARTFTAVEQAVSNAIGYEPVHISIDGHPGLRLTHRTGIDRDALVSRIAPLLARAEAESDRLREIIKAASVEAELSNFEDNGFLDDRSRNVKERAEGVLAILAKAVQS